MTVDDRQPSLATAEAPRPDAEPAARWRSGRPRCAVVVNPYSSGMTSARERVIVQRLREHCDVEVRRTERGGHAPRIAQEIVEDGTYDVIVTCGGDGTANEVLNGMGLAEGTADTRPAVAILPAGGTNVFARSLGMPNHPIRALKHTIEALVERRTRTVNLAKVDERLFTFSAGVGLDAELVRRMDQRRSGRRPSDVAYIASIVGIYASSRFAIADQMTIRIEDTGEELRSAVAMVGNTTPLTYLGRLPVHFMPDCTLDGGFDIVAPTRTTPLFSMRAGAQAVGIGRAKHRLLKPHQLQLRHDLHSITIECDDPLPVQADGEFLGDRTHITLHTVQRAVRLVI